MTLSHIYRSISNSVEQAYHHRSPMHCWKYLLSTCMPVTFIGSIAVSDYYRQMFGTVMIRPIFSKYLTNSYMASEDEVWGVFWGLYCGLSSTFVTTMMYEITCHFTGWLCVCQQLLTVNAMLCVTFQRHSTTKKEVMGKWDVWGYSSRWFLTDWYLYCYGLRV